MAQAFFSNATTYSSTIWTFIIIYILYKTTVKRTDRIKLFTKKCEWFAIAMGYGIPVVMSVIPFFFKDVYGNAGMWCWIRLPCVDDSPNTVRTVFMLIQYGIFWILTSISLFLFCRVWTWMEKFAL